MHRPLLSLLLLTSLFASQAWSAEEAVAEQAAVQQAEQKSEASSSSAADAKKFDDLITGLDSEEYAERQAASKSLGEEGLKALPALEKGATSVSREVSMRCLELIRKLFESADADTKTQAKAALEKLSQSADVPLSARAKKLLEPPAAPAQNTPANPNIRVVPIPAGAIGPIRLQIQAIGGVGGKGQQIRISEKDGVKDIEATEGGRKVKIHDDPNKGIEVEITETKDGKEETKKYEAKNAEELKKNHPEAHEAYKDISKRGPKIEAFGGFGGILPAGGAVPVPIAPALPIVPGGDPDALRKVRLEGIERNLENMQRMINELEKQKTRLLEQKAELEKEAVKPAEKTPVVPEEAK